MSRADMFLKVEGAKQGAIKGESSDPKHLGEIEIAGFQWGMEANATAFGTSTARTTFQELVVRKHVDSASTGLMSALRSNEVVKKATLSVRKAGGASPVPYLVITLEKARVVAHRLNNVVDAHPQLTEEFRLAFFKIQIEYRTQGDDGASKGVNTFDAEVQTG